MDKAKGVVKGGWHPKGKDGGKESWRGDFKGINQVAGWVGKGKDPNASAAQENTSRRPLQSLKDPSAFGPPPKNVNYHGGTAVPNAITPDRRGLGRPLSEDKVQTTRQQEEEAAAEAAKKPAPPPVPYRVDRTGLNTSNLPPPPTRATHASEEVQSPATKPKPRLPPRLPPRQNSQPAEPTPAPPPPYSAAVQEPEQQQQQQPPQPSFLNQTASNRPGGAGVKVPGLGIGANSSPSPAASQAQSPSSITTDREPSNPWRDQTSSSSPSTISGLTNRFGSLRTAAAATSPGPATQPPPAPLPPSASASGGTTLAQKQAALKTAHSFRNDPGSVSMADARATASTAKNFNDRHGEQVASGWKAGNAMNTRYGITDKVGGYAGQRPSLAGEGTRETGGNSGAGGAAGGGGRFGQAAAALGGFKKAPPPPPPATRSNTGGGLASPPPVPLGSKPR